MRILLGKTECWFVLQADEGTKMVMGHHAKTKDEFVKAIENDDYEQSVKFIQDQSREISSIFHLEHYMRSAADR